MITRLRSVSALLPLLIAFPACGGGGAGALLGGSPAGRARAEPAHTGGGSSLSRWIDRTPGSDAAAPSAAEDCVMIYDPVEHRIVLFGGKSDDDVNQNEVWVLDLGENRWQRLEVEGERPPPSEDAVAIYDPVGRRMIVHGGENGPTQSRTWSLDLETPRWREIVDPSAPAREDHSAVYDSHARRMVVFGGRDNERVNLDEVWALDLDRDSPHFERWRLLPADGKRPQGRSDHAAVFDAAKNRMLVYGGWDKKRKEYLDDTWAFAFADEPDGGGHWSRIKAKHSHPPRRRHAVGVVDEFRNWLIVFGGFGDEGYLNDVWAFDLGADEWINITPGPRARIDHQAVYDPLAHRLVVWGGDARLAKKFHDLWELEILSEEPAPR
jgi:hypothetical protein